MRSKKRRRAIDAAVDVPPGRMPGIPRGGAQRAQPRRLSCAGKDAKQLTEKSADSFLIFPHLRVRVRFEACLRVYPTAPA